MFFKSRSFKRGTFSAALTAIVIVAVVVINVIVTALAQKYYWYIDMTKDNVFKVSDEGMAILEGIDNEINIIEHQSLLFTEVYAQIAHLLVNLH